MNLYTSTVANEVLDKKERVANSVILIYKYCHGETEMSSQEDTASRGAAYVNIVMMVLKCPLIWVYIVCIDKGGGLQS